MVVNLTYSESIWAHLAIPTMYNRGLVKGVVSAQSQDELLCNLLLWAFGGLEPFRPVRAIDGASLVDIGGHGSHESRVCSVDG